MSAAVPLAVPAARPAARLPGSGVVALAVVLALWLVAAVSPLFARRAAEIRLEERLRAPSAAHLVRDRRPRARPARARRRGDADLARDRPDGRRGLARRRVRGRRRAPGISAGSSICCSRRVVEVVLCFPVLFLLLALAAFLPPSPACRHPGDRPDDVARRRALRAGGGPEGQGPRLHAGRPGRGRLDAADPRCGTCCPTSSPPLLVSAAFGVAWAILAEAALSFLGVGLPPPATSWGGILAAAPTYIDEAWWMALFPGLALFLTVAAYNLLAEGLRAATVERGRE